MKNIFLDLDGTVTESRSLVTPAMESLLKKLVRRYNVCLISGAELSQMEKQIPGILTKGFFVMPQTGNNVYGKDGQELWKWKLDWRQQLAVLRHIEVLKRFNKIKPLTSEADTVENRGCQISYSAIGHHALLELKKKFDSNGEKRSYWLKKAPLKSKIIEARAGGTTCIDYTAKGRHKGTNVLALVRFNKWKIKDTVYLGDALYKGGNDEAVIGVCRTILVKNPQETYDILSRYFKK